ncbi:uncharacterized protein [Linepithema humile]|uniref:uncharacterized protein n=1 Tax=Linepithema humile TaxID=83485 RepID=UPI0006230EAC|nr:PREDICTED: uncharacterized protein LOC105674824 [Linepithema humile]XP_012226823.1 PREDICTED: uncharacterized protein LOC105674824 [Linepithema humile]
MELTHLFVVHLLAVLSVHALLVRGNEELDITEGAITEEQQKVHDECRNPDYKKYVKCLMRPKRQHHTNHGDGIHESDPTFCLESCLKKCDHQREHDCEKKCSYCTKRTRHRHQIITEYETECVSGNCSPSDGLKTTNITTNIDIHNVINTFDNTTCGAGGICPSGRPCVNGTCIPNGARPPGMRPPGGMIPPEGGLPSLPIIPQISLVPQITYAYTGCVYSQWLCAQVVQQPDCSGCGHPLLHYRCDVKCYAFNNNVTNNN